MKQAEKNKLSKERILNAAIRDFIENNLQDISINRICQQNNISKGLLYHYYKSKDDLFCSCFRYSIQKLADDISSFKVNNNLSICENLHNYYEERIEFWCRNTYDFLIIKQVKHSMRNALFYDNIEDLRKSMNIYRKASDSKLTEILSCYKLNYNVSDKHLLFIMSMVYENMFMNSMDKIVYAVKEKNIELAEEKSKELLTLYDGLINILIFGIIDKDHNISD